MKSLLLLMIAATTAAAQTSRTLPAPGDTVRVWAVTPPLEDARVIVRRVAADTIVFGVRSAVERQWFDTPVEIRDIRRIEVRDGFHRSRKRTVIGYATGALLGLGAGGYIVYRGSPVYCDPSKPCGGSASSEEVIESAVSITIGAVSGAAIGGGVGWLIGRRPVARWRQVYP